MTRFITTMLFLGIILFGVWSFVAAADYGWWLPPNVSTFGPDIDNLFYLILWMVTFFFVLTEGVLVWVTWRYSRKATDKGSASHGNHKMELMWTAVPGLLLLVIAFAQMGTWARIRFEGQFPDAPVIADVYASQFDWRFVYPGEDGKFDTADDVDSPYQMVVPVNEKIVFNLISRDVIHSFFVPQLRFKQDAMPGMRIPCWFEVTEPGTYDIVCAELCGWGHYKMAGQLKVLPRDEYDAWLAQATDQHYSNGSEAE